MLCTGMWSGFGVMWSGTSVAGIFVKYLKMHLEYILQREVLVMMQILWNVMEMLNVVALHQYKNMVFGKHQRHGLMK